MPLLHPRDTWPCCSLWLVALQLGGDIGGYPPLAFAQHHWGVYPWEEASSAVSFIIIPPSPASQVCGCFSNRVYLQVLGGNEGQWQEPIHFGLFDSNDQQYDGLCPMPGAESLIQQSMAFGVERILISFKSSSGFGSIAILPLEKEFGSIPSSSILWNNLVSISVSSLTVW